MINNKRGYHHEVEKNSCAAGRRRPAPCGLREHPEHHSRSLDSDEGSRSVDGNHLHPACDKRLRGRSEALVRSSTDDDTVKNVYVNTDPSIDGTYVIVELSTNYTTMNYGGTEPPRMSL